ncbi:MAG TPA: helix-turn-helix domain-containing protein [Mycobacterium sp.]|nr:helix-turn-helix domain-containing protein [Mycobacterium sp.]
MAEDVKTRRYDSSRRQERSRATRRRIVEAARELFVERGYPATSVEAISAAADAAPATVYRLFPAKRAILKAVIDVTAVGDDEPDPVKYLAGFARVARTVGVRLAPIQQMLRSAAVVDSDAMEMLELINRQRYAGQGVVARGLVERNALAPSLTEDRAHDIIYALMSPELRRVLMHERQWSADRYEKWLADTLCATLLSTPRPRRSRR